jgi:hypothetical protein
MRNNNTPTGPSVRIIWCRNAVLSSPEAQNITFREGLSGLGRALGLAIARMPENMFHWLFGLGVKEKVFVLTHLVRVGILLDARPLCKFSVIRAEGCLSSRKRCTHNCRHQD